MTWDDSRPTRYFYRSVRMGETVRRLYQGSGPAGALAEYIASRSRARTAALRERTARVRGERRQLLKALVDFDRQAQQLANAVLVDSGYYRHHQGEWRRRRMPVSNQLQVRPPNWVSPVPTGFGTLVEQANAGDLAARDELRRVLDQQPGIWGDIADLESAVLELLLTRLAPRNVLLAESLKRRVEGVRQELVAGDDNPAIRLLARRVALAWLALQLLDLESIIHSGDQRMRERDAAERRYAGTLRELERVRSLLAGGRDRNPS